MGIRSPFCVPRLGLGHGQAGPLFPMGLPGDNSLDGHDRDSGIAGRKCWHARIVAA